MWQVPGRVLDTLGLKEGMSVADVGAGEGYFTWRMAERVGKEGKVYANEIEKRLVDRISHESKDRGLTNVVPVQGTPHDPKLPENAVDVILMVNVAHFLEEPEAFYRKLKTSLREGGKLAVVQWDSTKMNIEHEMDPSEMKKYSEEAVVAPVEAAGFEIVAKETFLPVQNLYICQPK
jgi:predicted methyltransferase